MCQYYSMVVICLVFVLTLNILIMYNTINLVGDIIGPVAQLGARFNRTEEVAGSNPARSTTNFWYKGPWRSWERVSMALRRSRVRVPLGPFYFKYYAGKVIEIVYTIFSFKLRLFLFPIDHLIRWILFLVLFCLKIGFTNIFEVLQIYINNRWIAIDLCWWLIFFAAIFESGKLFVRLSLLDLLKFCYLCDM